MDVVMTCAACPEQYDIYLADGKYAYFRYRFGKLTIDLFPSYGSVDPGRAIASVSHNWSTTRGEYDGMLEEGEALKLINERLPNLLAVAARS